MAAAQYYGLRFVAFHTSCEMNNLRAWTRGHRFAILIPNRSVVNNLPSAATRRRKGVMSGTTSFRERGVNSNRYVISRLSIAAAGVFYFGIKSDRSPENARPHSGTNSINSRTESAGAAALALTRTVDGRGQERTEQLAIFFRVVLGGEV